MEWIDTIKIDLRVLEVRNLRAGYRIGQDRLKDKLGSDQSNTE